MLTLENDHEGVSLHRRQSKTIFRAIIMSPHGSLFKTIYKLAVLFSLLLIDYCRLTIIDYCRLPYFYRQGIMHFHFSMLKTFKEFPNNNKKTNTKFKTLMHPLLSHLK